MNKLRIILVLGFMLGFSVLLQAQFIIEQIAYDIPINHQQVPANKDFTNVTDKAEFFLQLSESKLKNLDAGKKNGGIKVYPSTIYIDDDNFTLDGVVKGEGKISMIYNHNENILYVVSWTEKKIRLFRNGDMAGIQNDMEAKLQEELAQLSPEEQAQAKMAMEMVKKMRKKQPQTTTKITATGREMTKYGRKCNEYLLEDNQKSKVIWASEDNMGLAIKVKSMFTKLAQLIPSMNREKNIGLEWVDGNIPVVVCTLHPDALDNTKMEVRANVKITQTEISADKFILPAETAGFKRISIKELKEQM